MVQSKLNEITTLMKKAQGQTEYKYSHFQDEHIDWQEEIWF